MPDRQERLPLYSERLFRLRTELRLTQQQLAARIGRPQSTIRSWEVGIAPRITAFVEAMLAVAGACDVTCDYLLGRTESRTALPDGQFIVDDELVEQILHLRTQAGLERVADSRFLAFDLPITDRVRIATMPEIRDIEQRITEHLIYGMQAQDAYRKFSRRHRLVIEEAAT